MNSRIKSRAASVLRSRKGSMLAFALIFGLIISVMLLPILSFTTQVTKVTGGTKSSDQAFYAAEAGVSRAIAEIIALAGDGDPDEGTSKILQALNTNTIANATSTSPWYPWGDEWKTMNYDDETADADDPEAKLCFKVSVWRNAVAPGAGNITYTIRSTGRSLVPREVYRTVSVQIQARAFSGYAFFNTTSLSSMDGLPRWLAPGETFNGVVHSNRHLFVYGSSGNPLTFNSDVEIVGSEVKSSNPVIYNGLLDQNASYVELPSDLTALKNAADNGGLRLPADDSAKNTNAPNTYVDPVTTASSQINNYELVFNADGTVTVINLDLRTWMTGTSAAAATWRTANGLTTTTAAAKAQFTVDLGDINGAIVIDQGNAFVSGTLSGRVTVGALANDNSTTLISPLANNRSDGNIIVNGNLVYNTHPKLANGSLNLSDTRDFDPNVTTDILGLIAERNFLIDGSVPNNGVLDAHIMVTGQASPNPHVWNEWNQTTNTSTVISQAINQDGAFFVERGVQRDLSELWTGVVDSSESGNGTGTYSVSGSQNFYLTGGIVHFLRGQTANGTAGITRKYAYDTRLGTNPPPFYPMTPDISIVGWTDESSTTDPT